MRALTDIRRGANNGLFAYKFSFKFHLLRDKFALSQILPWQPLVPHVAQSRKAHQADQLNTLQVQRNTSLRCQCCQCSEQHFPDLWTTIFGVIREIVPLIGFGTTA
jgi:hypothetical protein